MVETVGRRAVGVLRRAVEGGHGAGEGGQVLLHKASKAHVKVATDASDVVDDGASCWLVVVQLFMSFTTFPCCRCCSTLLSKVVSGLVHGPGQIEQEVDVHRVLAGLRDGKLQPVSLLLLRSQ